MSETAIGYLLIGIGIVFVLGLVFALTSAAGRRRAAPASPPRGVHMPNPSLLPVLFSFAAALIGAGLAFRPEDALANWFLLVPGLLLLVVSSIGWVRAAGREWREVEHGAHHDDTGH